ncbi:MAG TPA: glycosyltransferase [Opitutaceae bacterium]
MTNAHACMISAPQNTHLTSHFIPYWPDNPYQPLLKAGLAKENVTVETKSTLVELASCVQKNEIVHLHWLPQAKLGPRQLYKIFQFVRGLHVLKRRGTPIIWTAHNLIPHESQIPRLDLCLSRRIAHLADCIICHSDSARSELLDKLQLTEASKIRVIAHGHYIDSYPNETTRKVSRSYFSLGDEDLVLLFLGRIRAYKGVFDLLDAFQKQPSRNLKLLIAGKPHTSQVDQEVRARVAADQRVIYRPGYLPDTDIQLYMNAADAVVFPYQKSLTSGALILAMSFGRACIAPHLAGTVDCLADQGGILYRIEDPGGLIKALSTVENQKDGLARMGERNLERAKSWEWQPIARATAECYRQAIESKITVPCAQNK